MEQNCICWCPEVIDSWELLRGAQMTSVVIFSSQELSHCQPILFCCQSHSFCVVQCLLFKSPCCPHRRGCNISWVTFLLPPNQEHSPQNCTVNTSHTLLTRQEGAAETSSLHLEKLLSYPSLPHIPSKSWQKPSHTCNGSREVIIS